MPPVVKNSAQMAGILALYCVASFVVDPYSVDWLPSALVPIGAGFAAGLVLRWPWILVLVVAAPTWYLLRGLAISDNPLVAIGVLIEVPLLGVGIGAGTAVRFAVGSYASRARSARSARGST